MPVPAINTDRVPLMLPDCRYQQREAAAVIRMRQRPAAPACPSQDPARVPARRASSAQRAGLPCSWPPSCGNPSIAMAAAGAHRCMPFTHAWHPISASDWMRLLCRSGICVPCVFGQHCPEGSVLPLPGTPAAEAYVDKYKCRCCLVLLPCGTYHKDLLPGQRGPACPQTWHGKALFSCSSQNPAGCVQAGLVLPHAGRGAALPAGRVVHGGRGRAHHVRVPRAHGGAAGHHGARRAADHRAARLRQGRAPGRQHLPPGARAPP